MHTPVQLQTWRMSVLFLAGIVTNVVFQAYTAFRRVFVPRKLSRHLMDTLFSLAVFTFATIVVFIVNWGELRLYVPFCLGFGFITSNFLVGGACYALAYRYFRLTQKCALWTKKSLVGPVAKFFSKVGTGAKRLLLPGWTGKTDPPDFSA